MCARVTGACVCVCARDGGHACVRARVTGVCACVCARVTGACVCVCAHAHALV